MATTKEHAGFVKNLDQLDKILSRPSARNAADFIVETARRNPGQVTLIAVGPLQNLADALRKEPQLGKLVKRVVLMRGCV